MKFRILFWFLALNSVVYSQTLKSIDNRVAKLPAQFIVSPEGVKWMQPGAREPTLVAWDRIDLEALAKEEPMIEEARQKAILTQKEIFLSVPPPRNYFKEFLALPVNVEFKQDWKAVAKGRATYSVSTDGYVDYNSGSYSAKSRITGNTVTSIKYIDKTRPSLNTTVEGLLLTLSDDSKLDNHRLVNDLKESGAVYQNIRMAFTSLQTAYPNDLEIKRTAASLDRLIAEKTTSVDAMRQLGAFVAYAKSK